MALIAAYTGATTGGVNGTLVSADGSQSSAIVFTTLGTAVTAHVRCSPYMETPSAVVVTPPSAAFTVSADNSTFGSSANIGVVGSVNVPVYIKQVSNLARRH
jgi:hypothetical protein